MFLGGSGKDSSFGAVEAFYSRKDSQSRSAPIEHDIHKNNCNHNSSFDLSFILTVWTGRMQFMNCLKNCLKYSDFKTLKLAM